MTPENISYYYVGQRGCHEKDIHREDGKISNRYIRLIGIENPKFLDTYIEITTWDIDKRVDIKAQKKPANSELSFLFDNKLSSYKYGDDPYSNFIKLSALTKSGLHPLSLTELNTIVGGSITAYFKGKFITVLKSEVNPGIFEYYVKHQYYSDSEIFEIYKVCVLCPLLNSFKQNTPVKADQHTTEINTPSSFETLKNKIIAFFLISIFFAGCFTMITRKRIGCDCNDGTHSSATGSGACSSHGGVSSWTHEYWWNRK